MRESVRFFGSFLAHPLQVGAIVPTSRRTVRHMLDMADIPAGLSVAEFGAGTGVYTSEILQRAAPDAQVLAFEIDPVLASKLSARLEDRRLRVINDSVERVEDYLDGSKIDIIVSSLPFTAMPKQVKRTILEQVTRILHPDGVMLVIQYSTLLEGDLRRRFASVRRRASLLNVPPAFLFACRAPVEETSGS
ncbi:MAG: methyltransferase domain-containing protein [Actinomycetota bacterium]|nr:methyltransferase domain-containing protein [Actinomycetota bacterium]